MFFEKYARHTPRQSSFGTGPNKYRLPRPRIGPRECRLHLNKSQLRVRHPRSALCPQPGEPARTTPTIQQRRTKAYDRACALQVVTQGGSRHAAPACVGRQSPSLRARHRAITAASLLKEGLEHRRSRTTWIAIDYYDRSLIACFSKGR